MEHHFVAAAAGLISPPIFAALAAAIAAKIRARRFRKFKAEPAPLPDFLPDLPDPHRTVAEARLDGAMYEALQTEHNLAKTLQDRAFASLVAASAGLLVAFLITTAAATLLAASEASHVFSAGADVSALLLMAWMFWRSATARAQWLRQRSRVEFVRQWVAVEPLIRADANGITTRLSAFEARVNAALDSGAHDFHAKVAALAEQRGAEIEAEISNNSALSAKDLHHYLVTRPLRQVRWFSTSYNRIGQQHELRRLFMLGLFTTALLAAIVKLVSVVTMGPHHAHGLTSVATFLLLVSIGLATALTSTFAGQSLRSIRHRYAIQMESFRRWFKRNRALADVAQSSADLSENQRSQIAASVAQFESLMLAELLDWITITGDDAMELAPI